MTSILSFGSVYLDINSLDFPNLDTLNVEEEIVGENYEISIGGSAANFCNGLSLLGLTSVFISKIGDDSFGYLISDLFKKTKIDFRPIVSSNSKSNIGINLIQKNGKRYMVVLGNSNKTTTSDDFLEEINKSISDVKYLYLGGVNKLKLLDIDFFINLIKTAKQHGVSVIFDHGRFTNFNLNENLKKDTAILGLLDKTDFYIPSDDEFLSLMQEVDLNTALKKYLQITDCNLIIKQSEMGASYVLDNKFVNVNAFKVTTTNTVGAGDAFNAGFIKSISESSNIATAVRDANKFASLKISGYYN